MKKSKKVLAGLMTLVMLVLAMAAFAACSEQEVSGIAITARPEKTSYVVGSSFSTTGMVVTATYVDGTTKAVTGYTVSKTGALSKTDTSITVTYKDKTATQPVYVHDEHVALELIVDDTGVGASALDDEIKLTDDGIFYFWESSSVFKMEMMWELNSSGNIVITSEDEKSPSFPVAFTKDANFAYITITMPWPGYDPVVYRAPIATFNAAFGL